MHTGMGEARIGDELLIEAAATEPGILVIAEIGHYANIRRII